MMRRKICLWLMIFGFLGFLGSRHQVQAGEVDALHLINLLKQKGVLTQEEADGLMKEARKQAQAEKAELKEEIKKEGEKGSYLPKALKDFGFSTTMFAEYNLKDTEGGKTQNQFLLNRLYLTFKKKVTPWLGFNATTDIFTSKDANDVGNGLEVRMKYAMAQLYLGGTTTELGLIHNASDMYDSDIWPYRVQGKHFLDRHGIQASADYGVGILGPFGPTVDKKNYYGSNNYDGKWGGYQVGVYNGPGYDNPGDNNNNKVISGLVYFRPLPNIDQMKGLQLAYVGSYGQSDKNFTANGKTNDFPDWQINIGQLSYQHKWFTLMGQYYWGKGTKNSTEDNDRSGWVAAGFVRIPGAEKMRLFGKVDYYDPNKDVSNDGVTTYIAGISYDLTKEFMPYMAWERTDNENPKTGDSNMYQIGFQYKF